MTEDEAKTIWCPMVRHAEAAAGEYHEREEFVATNRLATCCGSRCMMWRWSYLAEVIGDTGIATLKETEHGYCGLAGKP